MQFHSSRTGPPAASLHPANPQGSDGRSGHARDSVLPPVQEEARGRPLPTSAPGEHPGSGTLTHDEPSQQPLTAPRRIGKYLVSPFIHALENGWFASSVSIRSGSGTGTTDRVLRLTRLFRCTAEAAECAHTEALQWIGGSHAAAA